MILSRRFAAPAAALLAASVLAACGATAPSSPAATDPTAPPVASVAPSVDMATRDAFNVAMCPVLVAVRDLDPRLAAMRAAGAAGGDMTPHGTEIDALTDELGGLLTDLEAVPEWTEGAGLQFQLTTGLHGIRARLLRASEDLSARSAAAELAAIPYLASEAMDRAAADAVEGGLDCRGES